MGKINLFNYKKFDDATINFIIASDGDDTNFIANTYVNIYLLSEELIMYYEYIKYDLYYF